MKPCAAKLVVVADLANGESPAREGFVSKDVRSRRNFLKAAVGAAGATLFSPTTLIGQTMLATPSPGHQSETGPADYILRIASSPVEIAPKRIVSTIAYNGQFPGPLLRFKEGQPATVEVHNDTDTPEQLHWHGQMVSADIDQHAGKAPLEIPALKPYWGKPAVRNFRGGDGNVGIIRSPVRAIALPDNRHVVGDERALQERRQRIHPGLESCK